MADAQRSRRRSSIAGLLSDVLDDTKDLVDDTIDRAGDLESRGRRTARRVVDDPPAKKKKDKAESTGRQSQEIADLNAAIADLTAKVARLAEAAEQQRADPT
ncbi:MAG: hypothetical protein ACT4QG_14710 [Sporichthyaceae bacterium]